MDQLNSNTFKLINTLPSFSRGVARIFDFSGSLDKDIYNKSKTSKQADYEAIRGDWETVGDDILISFSHYSKESDLNENYGVLKKGDIGKAE